MRLPQWTTAAVLLLATGARAVRVTKGSQCEVKCGNVLDQTNPDDIVCEANQFTSTSAGQVFSSCVNCELGSSYTSKKENDLWWMLCKSRVLRLATTCISDTKRLINFDPRPQRQHPVRGIILSLQQAQPHRLPADTMYDEVRVRAFVSPLQVTSCAT